MTESEETNNEAFGDLGFGQRAQAFRNEAAERIEMFVRKIRLTYPSEVGRELFLSKEVVGAGISQLIAEGKIQRFQPKFIDIAPAEARRLSDFHSRGIIGYEAFQRVQFIIPSDYDPWRDKFVKDQSEISDYDTLHKCDRCYKGIAIMSEYYVGTNTYCKKCRSIISMGEM